MDNPSEETRTPHTAMAFRKMLQNHSWFNLSITLCLYSSFITEISA